MDKIQIKKKIIEFVKLELEKKINFLKKSINDAQKEAASHKGRMESRYDTFREEARFLTNSLAPKKRELSKAPAWAFILPEKLPKHIRKKSGRSRTAKIRGVCFM